MGSGWSCRALAGRAAASIKLRLLLCSTHQRDCQGLISEDLPSLSPIFSHHLGKLSCRYLRQYIELGHEIRNLPLSQVEIEALDLFDEIMHREDFRLSMMLEPGDLQFANNYAVLHSRNEFEDHGVHELNRKMLRLWVKMPNARTLAPEFPGRNGFPAPLV